ncbi:MAG TPA: hypothetical protein DEA22_09250 [Blastocatellia bacterium]|nr:hypothetical protein [Blastocatellia bacterium]
MLLRAIALSIALLIGIGTIIPLATEYAEAGSHKTKKYKKRKRYWRGVKKYSKRWWRLYRAQERRKRAAAKRRRSLRLRQLRAQRAREAAKAKTQAAKTKEKTPVAVKETPRIASVLPSGQPAPKGWAATEATGGEVRFNIGNVGSASISVLGPATGETVKKGRMATLGGVPTASLRREVINRMIRENGWVVNDYQKEIGGKTVFVVVAQSQEADGRINSRMFYFTEADGRIYSVATNSGTNAAERIAEESEKVILSLGTRPRPVQQASTKE